MTRRLFGIAVLCLTVCFAAGAQWKWTNPMDAGFPVIQNQGWADEIGHSYVRLPDRAKADVREAVWNLSRNSSGLAIHFYCNAPKITVRYRVSGGLNMPHMPSTGVSGIDLYSIDSEGRWNFCSGGFSFGDTITYTYTDLGRDKFHNRGFEYRLYLPLYNSVQWLDIGTPEESEIKFIPRSDEKPVVIYGTSIVHGACASRPAMSWTNILQRALDCPIINLGFSGNGKPETGVLNYITEQDARLYVLDCLPNLTEKTDSEVTDLVIAAVRQIREKRDAPILLVEHAGYSNGASNHRQYALYTRLNAASRRGYEALLREGVEKLYYLSHDELGIPADGLVDAVHLSDLGATAQASAVEKKVRSILHLQTGCRPTMQPVTQRREPDNYEWQTRHRDILKHLRANPPRAVILGNSITHFWGGEPAGPHKNGAESWERVMAKAGFQNLGYGWDRIENVLWRIHHGEMDGYEADKVVLMIGTNNMGMSSDEDIVEGLRFLVSAIRDRQPRAAIKVIGILPRRDHEDWVRNVNLQIRIMANEEGCMFRDAGTALLLPSGKIDESLFSDGLHPNEKGYGKIANTIAE